MPPGAPHLDAAPCPGLPAAAFSDDKRVGSRRGDAAGGHAATVGALPNRGELTRNDAKTVDLVVVYIARVHAATGWHSLC